MDYKPGLVLVLAAMAMVVAEASKVQDIGWSGSVGDLEGKDNEMLMDSEVSRRTMLEKGRYIPYKTLSANWIPCGGRGRSYSDCQQRERANPYRRGCSVNTRCYRLTD